MMKENRGKMKAVTGILAVIVIVSAWSLSAAEDSGRQRFEDPKGEAIKAIERRLEALEKLVGPSRTPISERMDVLEKGLRDLTRAIGGTGWSRVESNIREAKKALEKQKEFVERAEIDLAKISREMDEMDRRVGRLESRK